LKVYFVNERLAFGSAVSLAKATRRAVTTITRRAPGHAAEAKTALSSLAASAQRKRYGLIARKASAALR
jgi:hypothetical protein